MSSESRSIATFSVIVLFPIGKPIEITQLSYPDAVKRAAHERQLWAKEPGVTITIQPEF